MDQAVPETTSLALEGKAAEAQRSRRSARVICEESKAFLHEGGFDIGEGLHFSVHRSTSLRLQIFGRRPVSC
jgi:hypothetical protein